MPSRLRFAAPRVRPCLAASLLALALSPAWADKADRLKQLNIESERQGRIDVVNHRIEFIGDVVLSKGSLVMRAQRLDLRETADGYHQAYAAGDAQQQVSFRQGRDVPGEFIEGRADQIEYDSRADTVRFTGNAVVRRTKNGVTADEVTGAVVLYDNRSEVFSVEGGQASPHPTGRVRVVIMPRGAAASEPEAPAPVKLQPSSPSPRKPS